MLQERGIYEPSTLNTQHSTLKSQSYKGRGKESSAQMLQERDIRKLSALNPQPLTRISSGGGAPYLGTLTVSVGSAIGISVADREQGEMLNLIAEVTVTHRDPRDGPPPPQPKVGRRVDDGTRHRTLRCAPPVRIAHRASNPKPLHPNSEMRSAAVTIAG